MSTTEQFLVNAGTVPPPDALVAGPRGAMHTDIAKITSEVDLKRGTLLMFDAEMGCVPCTAAGLSEAKGFAILADDVTFGQESHASAAAYFEGDFNEAAVIFPWLDDEGGRPEALEAAREPLRQAKIFLRAAHD